MRKCKRKSIFDCYRVSGFRTLRRVKGRFGDPEAIVIRLARHQKKLSAVDALRCTGHITISGYGKREILVLGIDVFIWNMSSGELSAEFATE